MKQKCDRFSVLITRYIDGELKPMDRDEVKTHLGQCSKCKEDYLQEIQVKNLVKDRLANVKAPAHLQSRIRRNLIRSGSRPGFWQLLHSMFLYRPVATSFALALIALLMFLPTIQIIESPFDLLGRGTETAKLEGEIICVDCEFLSNNLGNAVHDQATHRSGLQAEDETIWTFVRGNSNKELFQDQSLLRKKALVSGILFRNSQYIYVQEYKLL